MNNPSFGALVEQASACCEALYHHCQSQQWDESVILLKEREQLLAQLANLAQTLSPYEIEILANLYQDILENDAVYLTEAESEQTQVKKQLRHIKRAELSALPAYRENS